MFRRRKKFITIKEESPSLKESVEKAVKGESRFPLLPERKNQVITIRCKCPKKCWKRRIEE